MKRTKMSAILVLRSELLRRVALVLALGLMVCQAKVSNAAEMGTAFTYQGRLIDANTAADGLYDFQFKLFDDANTITGNQVGSDVNKPDLDVIDGYFTVELDFGSGIFDGNAVWLETTVAQSDGSDPCTLSPRQELTPTPYAIYAMQASGLTLAYSGTVSSAASAFLVRNTGPGKAIQGIGQKNDGVTGGSYAAGRSGVFGYNDDADGFGVFGSSVNGIGVKGYTYGVTGKAGLFEIQNASNNNAALKSVTSGTGEGVYGEHSSSGNYGYLGGESGVYGYSQSGSGVSGESHLGQGVTGKATHTIGLNYGGYFTAAGSLGRGVYGSASGTSGRGVCGAASNNGDVYNYGGYFTSAGIHGKGVYGAATDNGDGLNVGGHFTANGRVAYGVEGYTPGQLGMGVYGHSPYNGVYGLSTGDNGHGVQGNAIGSGGHGIYGRASGTDGAAIYGRAENNSVTAIYGHGGTGGKAGYFKGNVHITGELTKAYTAGTSNPAAPIAYAFIYSNGNVSSGTPNVSCTWNAGYQRYEISISGESYLLWNYVTVVTSTGGAYTTAIGSGGGKMYITIYELSGNEVQAHFQFVTYKP